MLQSKQSVFGKKIKNIIYYLLLVYLLVDMINGFLLLSGYGISISSLYKTLLLVIMFFSFKYSKKEIIPIVMFLSVCIVSLFLNQSSSVMVSLFSNITKIWFCIIIFKYVEDFYSDKNYRFCSRIIKYNTIYFIINCAIGILGLGFSTYRTGNGIKGLFYAGNELSVTFYCLYAILLFRSKKKETQFILTIISIIVSILIGTKVAILAVLVLFIFTFISDKRYIIFKLFLILATLILLFIVFREQILNIQTINLQFSKFEYQLEKYNNNILNALISGRLSYLETYIKAFWQGNIVKNILFGVGVVNDKTVESDFFDIFFNYGIVVTLYVIVFYSKILIKSYKNKQLFVFNMLFLIIAIFAGHTLINTTTALFFAIVNLGLSNSKKQVHIITTNNCSVINGGKDEINLVRNF